MRTKVTVTLVMCAVLTTPALADLLGTANVQHTGVSPYRSMTIYGGIYNGLGGVQTGVYRHTITGSTVQGLTGYGFCIEMTGSTTGSRPYNVRTLDDSPIDDGLSGATMGNARANYIRELWAAHIDGALANVDDAAALQAAIWEIVYTVDVGTASWDVTKGYDSVTDTGFAITGNVTVTGRANSWLWALTGSGPLASLVALSNASYQDYVVQVPVPATVLLGLVGFAAAGRKLRRLV